VILIYVGTTSSDINVARVNNRVLLGGHHVPEEDIRRRYERSLANLPLAVARADYSLVFDNSTRNGFQLVAHFDHGTAQWFQEAPSWAAALATALARPVRPGDKDELRAAHLEAADTCSAALLAERSRILASFSWS